MKKKAIQLSVWVALVILAAACGGSEVYKRLSAGSMPEMGAWDGVYYSEAYGRMELTENGTNVVGLYEGERYKGKIEGIAEGDLLNFKWTQWNEDLNGKTRETTGHGYFRYTVVDEGTPEKSRLVHWAKGEWGYLEDNAGHAWEAVKFPDGTKKVLTLEDKAPEEAQSKDPFASSGSSSSSSSSSSDSGSSDSSGGGMDSLGGGGGNLDEDVNDLF
ncbi:MAG: hypothetical protein JXX29_07270 [Deltaproteobacteria bacterium]|nr:hypothetical protein [Deltaproteobacteria bacterium]MBN2671455.1 hypothetical protein [Deltaproteobacteria bacterium]